MKTPPRAFGSISPLSWPILWLLVGCAASVQMHARDYENLVAIRSNAPSLVGLWPDLNVLQNCGYIQNMNCSSSGQLTTLTIQGYEINLPISMFMNFSSTLTRLTIEDAGLHGDFPETLAVAYPNMTYLFIPRNNIAGTLPSNIGTMSKLQSLFLRKNHITNPLPLSMVNMARLQILALSGNRFTCPFPDELAAQFENMSQLLFVDLAGNNFSADSQSICWQRPYKKISVLPTISYDMSIPARAPSFLVGSPATLVEVYGNRVFIFGRSNLRGIPVPERRSFLVIQIQGVQLSWSPAPGLAPRVQAEFPIQDFAYMNYNDTSKEYRFGVQSAVFTAEIGIIVDPSKLAPGTSVKQSAYLMNLNYSGFNVSIIKEVSFPISLISKIRHTGPNGYLSCVDDQTVLYSQCIGPYVNASTFLDFGGYGAQTSVVFRQQSQIMELLQVWPAAAVLDGIMRYPGFEKFYAVFAPYGTAEYYRYIATTSGSLPDSAPEEQSFSQMFTMTFTGTPQNLTYDPDVSLYLLTDFANEQYDTPSQLPPLTVAEVSSGSATTGIVVGVIVIVVVVIGAAAFIKLRQANKQKKDMLALESRLKTAMSVSEPVRPPSVPVTQSKDLGGNWKKGSRGTSITNI